eukprot:3881611-Rhodomonas_salina.1
MAAAATGPSPRMLELQQQIAEEQRAYDHLPPPAALRAPTYVRPELHCGPPLAYALPQRQPDLPPGTSQAMSAAESMSLIVATA